MGDVKIWLIDASALVKLFLKEPGSEEVQNRLGSAVVFTTSLCFGEALGVLKRHRRQIGEEKYLAAAEELMAMFRDETIQIDDLEISRRDIFQEVENVASRHHLDISDSFQIVSLKRGFLSKLTGGSTPTLITADGPLEKAARSEGIAVWNCLTGRS